jgi:segregation and condensation protein B
LEELKAAGLLDDRLPPGFEVPAPDPDNDPEEDALEAGDDGSDLEPLEMDLPENLAGEASEDSASA